MMIEFQSPCSAVVRMLHLQILKMLQMVTIVAVVVQISLLQKVE
jgi:hypothetical protein